MASKTDPRTILVFTYGTLLRGEGNHRCLDGARFVGTATTAAAYTLFDTGGFPVAVPDGDTAIRGEVFAVNPTGLARLDRLEGYPHMYERKEIDTVHGRALIYYMDRERFDEYAWSRDREIPSGNWKRRGESEKDHSRTQKRSHRQARGMTAEFAF